MYDSKKPVICTHSSFPIINFMLQLYQLPLVLCIRHASSYFCALAYSISLLNTCQSSFKTLLKWCLSSLEFLLLLQNLSWLPSLSFHSSVSRWLSPHVLTIYETFSSSKSKVMSCAFYIISGTSTEAGAKKYSISSRSNSNNHKYDST